MADVFISYSQADRSLAASLAMLLDAAGYSVWWDTTLVSGEAYRAVIDAELSAASCVVVIWTPRSAKSDYVLDEASFAKRQGKLVPLRSHDLKADELPKGFGQKQTPLIDDLESLFKGMGAIGVLPRKLFEVVRSDQLAATADARSTPRRVVEVNSAVDAASIPKVRGRLEGVKLALNSAALPALMLVLGLMVIWVQWREIKGERAANDDLRRDNSKLVSEIAVYKQLRDGQNPQPTPSVELIVPFERSGPTFELARLLAAHMSNSLAKNVTPIPKPGQSGTHAVALVTRRSNDGNTLLLHHSGLAYTSLLFDRLPYRTLDDLEPVGMINRMPLVLIGNSSVRASNFQALLDAWRADPLQLNIAHAGFGSNSHACIFHLVEQQQRRGSCSKKADCWPNVNPGGEGGAGPALRAMVEENKYNLICDQSITAIRALRDHKSLRGIVAFAEQRFPSLPASVPVKSDGVQSSWHGLYVRSGTPPKIVDQLNKSLREFISDPRLIEVLKHDGIEPPSVFRQSPSGHREWLESQIETLRPRLSKITPRQIYQGPKE